MDNDNDNGGGTTGQASSSLLYVLQPGLGTIDDLAESNFKWLVLEPSQTDDAAGEFTNGEIQTIRSGGPCGEKTILAYLSIGEAEDYRDYWDTAWVDGDAGPPIPGVAPDWLGPTNPDWLGNYKVRYWDADWQALILGTPSGPGKTPLDRIIDAGFDGVYLDIVDAYYFWSEAEGGEELTRMEARRHMIEWVATIATYARETRGATGFQVFPQNASDIIRNDDDELDELSDVYFAAVSGIGVEDLYYDETKPQPGIDTQYRTEQLVEYASRDKTVLVTDYLLDGAATPAVSDTRVADFYARATDAGFIPYAAIDDRDLDEIAVLSGADWSVAQPPTGCAALEAQVQPLAVPVSKDIGLGEDRYSNGRDDVVIEHSFILVLSGASTTRPLAFYTTEVKTGGRRVSWFSGFLRSQNETLCGAYPAESLHEFLMFTAEPRFDTPMKLPCEGEHLLCFLLGNHTGTLVVGDVAFLTKGVQLSHQLDIRANRIDERLNHAVVVGLTRSTKATGGQCSRGKQRCQDDFLEAVSGVPMRRHRPS